jgi:glycosyltransferase involved in cell wall biosynthesis
MPNVLVEAAALGIPLIAARTGGMADVLEDGETALLFDPGDEAGCIWTLGRAAASDDVRRAEMGAGRARAGAELETERYLEALAQTAAVPG